MLSYADLEKTLRVERTTPTLQKLQSGFYDEARALAANPQVGEYKDAIKECLEKTYYLRANKIVHYAGRATVQTKPPENILPEEMPLYNKLLEAVFENRATLLDKPVEYVPPQAAKPTVKVRMKLAMPAIIGSDSKEYGPFKEDDVVELPQDSANLLIDRKVAELA